MIGDDTTRMPVAEEAEAGLIGGLLLDAVRLVPVVERMGAGEEWFYVPAHRAIFGAVHRLTVRGAPVDLLTVAGELTAVGDIERAGGVVGLERIIDRTPTAAHAEFYAEEVRKKAALRRVILTAHKLRADAGNDGAEADDIVARAINDLLDIETRPATDPTNAETLAASVQRFRDAMDYKNGDLTKRPATGFPFPIPSLDRMLCGLEPGITTIAGRPSAGKTSIEDQMIIELGKLGIGSCRWTHDQLRSQLLERAMCRWAGVSLPRLKKGHVGESHLARCAEAAREIGKLNMRIIDREGDIDRIAAEFRDAKRRHGAQVFTLDYFQLLRASGHGIRSGDKVQMLTYVSERLKDLSFELACPIVVLAQLNREVEKDGRLPSMADIKDCGALEQESDKIISLSINAKKRKEMDEKNLRATTHKRPVEACVLKNKNGEQGAVPLWFYPSYFRFEEARVGDDGQTAWVDDALPAQRQDEERAQRAVLRAGEEYAASLPGAQEIFEGLVPKRSGRQPGDPGGDD